MLYENYQKRIMRLARILAKFIKYFKIIAAVFAALILCVISLLAVKGNVGVTACRAQIVYGEESEYHARAFLSDVRYEFSGEGSEEWSEAVPEFPGKYKVRAVGNGAFGIKKYGKEAVFEILKKDIRVSVINTSMIYGDEPSVYADTVDGDTLKCEGYIYEEVTLQRVKATPNTEYLSVVRADGTDVTDAYNISVVTSNVDLAKRPITVTVEDSEAIYNGETFSYDQYEVSAGTLKDGDSIRAVFDQSLVNPGSVINQPRLSIVDKSGRDVTECYKITEKIGTISVVKSPLVITTESATLTYDAVSRSFEGYTLDENAVLAKGHELKVTGSNSFIDAGVYKNSLVFSVVNQYGMDVTENYSLLVNDGEIVIKPRVINVVTPSESWVYDAKAHSSTKIQSVTGLVDGHTVEYRTNESITDIGEKVNECTVRVLAKNKNVTANYEIFYEYGTLKCEKRPVTIRTGSVKQEYSGLYVTCLDYEIVSEYGLAFGQRIRSIDGSGITFVGKVENVFNSLEIVDNSGKDTTENYDITYEYGTIEVTKLVLHVKSATKSWVYDGEEHYDDSVWLLLGTLGAGDTFIVDSYTTITDVGTVQNKFEKYRIESKSTGENREDNYQLIFGWGELKVVKRHIIVAAPTVEKVYDGKALEPGEPALSADTYFPLVEGHTLSGKTVGARTDAGENDSEVTEVTITDGEKDVTGNYEVIKKNGTVTVRKRTVIVKTASASKIYDRTPLSDSGYVIAADSPFGIALGQSLKIDVLGAQTEVGSSENNYDPESVRITDGEKDVSENYNITVKLGKLKVELYAYVSIVAYSDVKDYDGLPLKNSGYKVYVIEGEMNEEHKLLVTVNGEQTEAGASPNTVDARIVDKNGNDVTFQYKLASESGTLTVKGTEKAPETVVAKVKTDKTSTLYLRKASYGDYTGKLWYAGVSYGKLLNGGYNYNYLSSFAFEEQGCPLHMAQLQIKDGFLLPYYPGTDGDYEKQGKDTVYYGEKDQYVLSYYESDMSELSPIKNNYTAGKYSSQEEEYREFVNNLYLTVDDATREYMNGIIQNQGMSRFYAYIISQVAYYIRYSAVYNENYDRALDHEENGVIAFLDKYKEGDSRHFATAATLLFRAIGIPARYVTGYKVETVAGQYVDVKTPEYAWVEVYVNGIGWIYVDVTPTDQFKKETLSITPMYVCQNYNGSARRARNLLAPDALLSDLLKQGYTYKVEISGEQTEVGRGVSKIERFELYDPEGVQVNALFNIVLNDGIIEVFPQERNIIKVYLYQIQKYYDGAPISFEDGDYRVLTIDEGASLDLECIFSLTDVGSVTLAELNSNIEKYFKFSVKKDGRDVTAEYTVVFDTPFEIYSINDWRYVPIRVDQRAIEITSATESKVYDGEALSNSTVTVTKGSLLNGDTLQASVNGYVTEVGTVTNEVIADSVKIIDKNGNDVTRNYKITIKNGTLTVVEQGENAS